MSNFQNQSHLAFRLFMHFINEAMLQLIIYTILKCATSLLLRTFIIIIIYIYIYVYIYTLYLNNYNIQCNLQRMPTCILWIYIL